MKRTLIVLIVVALALLGPASGAWAAPSHPSQGDNSTGRNEAGFGGGPHCHVLIVDSARASFETIRVFPSHTAHVHSGLADGVFAADPDCDGVL
jgi:hypothetical protein